MNPEPQAETLWCIVSSLWTNPYKAKAKAVFYRRYWQIVTKLYCVVIMDEPLQSCIVSLLWTNLYKAKLWRHLLLNSYTSVFKNKPFKSLVMSFMDKP